MTWKTALFLCFAILNSLGCKQRKDHSDVKSSSGIPSFSGTGNINSERFDWNVLSSSDETLSFSSNPQFPSQKPFMKAVALTSQSQRCPGCYSLKGDGVSFEIEVDGNKVTVKNPLIYSKQAMLGKGDVSASESISKVRELYSSRISRVGAVNFSNTSRVSFDWQLQVKPDGSQEFALQVTSQMVSDAEMKRFTSTFKGGYVVTTVTKSDYTVGSVKGDKYVGDGVDIYVRDGKIEAFELNGDSVQTEVPGKNGGRKVLVWSEFQSNPPTGEENVWRDLNVEINAADTQFKAKWTKLGLAGKKTYTDAERKVVEIGDKIHEAAAAVKSREPGRASQLMIRVQALKKSL
jgi:hypothetical protein